MSAPEHSRESQRRVRCFDTAKTAPRPEPCNRCAWSTRKSNRAGVYSQPELQLLKTIMANVTTALTKARMYTEMEKLATIDGLTQIANRKAGVLSGGEQQQLAIGRALAGQPELLLLDEPTEGIQPNIVQQIEDALLRVRKELGVAILIVEQNLDFAWSFAERYFVMQRGRIVKEGMTATTPPDEVASLIHV